MQHRTIRTVLLGVAFTGGAWVALTTLDGAAQAADHHRPAAVEQPGGLLGHLLPEQASARAHEVHGQVVPDKPEPAREEPADQPDPPKAEPVPEPESPEPPAAEEPAAPQPAEPASTEQPSEEPAPDPVVVDLPTDPVVEVPPAEVPPVVVEAPPVLDPVPPVVVETPPVVVEPAPTTEPAPAPDPIVNTLPTTEPAPLPLPLPVPLPVPVPTPTVVTPAPLPVLIGPIPAAQQPPTGVVAQLVTSLTAAEPDQPDNCADDPEDAVHINRDSLRALLGLVDHKPAAATPRAKPAPGCPSTPGHPDHVDCASTGATNSGQTNTGHVHADLADGVTAPALARLANARPRSHIPAGRHVAIEPGPA